MHIVLVCVDALRADHLGCYGSDRATPHVDRLATEGVCFRNAVAQSSWTAPSVTSLMTGLYPSQHDITDVPRLGPQEPARMTTLGRVPTLAEKLAESGYTTAAFVAGNAYLKPDFGVMRGFTHLDWRPSVDGAEVVEGFAAWLDTARPARSFSYLHLMDTHNPLPPELAPTRPLVDRGVDMGALQAGEELLLGYYAAAVAGADARIGEVVAALEARGLADDTWVIVTADHGEELNEHGVMLSHGQSLYRQLVWVPLIMRLPHGRFGGRAPAEPVSHIDLMPTILAEAGAAVPPVPGRNLIPLVEGRADAGPASGGAAYSELLHRVKYLRSITTATHHFIETYSMSEAPPPGLGDLVPGAKVEVKGHPAEGGAFLPTKVSIDDKAMPKLLGIVEAVDAAAGVVTIMGITFEVGADTVFVGHDKEPFALSELSPGDRVGAIFDEEPGPSGRPVAKRLRRRNPGGESRLEGPISSVQANGAGDGIRITVLGRSIPVDGQRVRLANRNDEAHRWSRDEMVDMVRQGRYVTRDEELYDITADPAEARNLAADEPVLAKELAGRLSAWAEALPPRPGGGDEVELDDDTIGRLRALGYLA